MTATGPGPLTTDGCAVELYAQLPELGEAALIEAALQPGDTVLDLGCGTGRLARPLLAAGHPVIGVDQSAEMLARLPEAPTVCAPIAGLDLGRTVDAVLLASHLVNVPADAELAALLSTARRHLRPGGTLVVQWHPPGWFETARSGAGGMLGPASVRLEGVTRSGELLSATVHYAIGTDEWTQTFVARRRDVRGLDEALHAAGFRRERWLSDDQTWFAASAE